MGRRRHHQQEKQYQNSLEIIYHKITMCGIGFAQFRLINFHSFNSLRLYILPLALPPSSSSFQPPHHTALPLLQIYLFQWLLCVCGAEAATQKNSKPCLVISAFHDWTNTLIDWFNKKTLKLFFF